MPPPPALTTEVSGHIQPSRPCALSCDAVCRQEEARLLLEELLTTAPAYANQAKLALARGKNLVVLGMWVKRTRHVREALMSDWGAGRKTGASDRCAMLQGVLRRRVPSSRPRSSTSPRTTC
jgi:hypothetical protein